MKEKERADLRFAQLEQSIEQLARTIRPEGKINRVLFQFTVGLVSLAGLAIIIRSRFKVAFEFSKSERKPTFFRPPFNAEYILYLVLRKDERDGVVGDLIEDYGLVRERFGKRRADVWFYRQVIGSIWPLLRRAVFRFGALVWLGRILRRLIS